MKMKVFEAKIKMGALLDVPIWSTHERGKNWFAKIAEDPSAPGGLAREFAKRARGKFYYFLPDSWGIGTPVEFGADYYTSRGQKQPNRWYGWIVERTEDRVIFAEACSAASAIKQAKEAKEK